MIPLIIQQRNVQKLQGGIDLLYTFCPSSHVPKHPHDEMVSNELVYRTEIHFIKKGHPLFTYCDETCLKSRSLYNHANFLIRQQYFYLETFLPYDGKEYSLYFQAKDHETYKALPAQTAEGILRKLEDNWHSFFASMKEWKADPSKFHGMPRPPKYKEKHGRFTAYFTNQQCKVKNGRIRFP